MSLKYPIVGDNQRGESTDFNRGSEYGLANLAIVLAGFMGGGLYRGGLVTQTTPATKNVIVQPLAGLTANKELLITETDQVLAIPDNASGQPRIDLVSVGYQLLNLPDESRFFWNPSTEVEFAQDTTTQKELKANLVVTVGTPAAIPVPPATPAGHIPLAYVSVANGFATILNAHIARAVAPNPLVATTFAGDGGLHPFPYEIPEPIIEVTTRAGGSTVLFAQATLTAVGSFNPAIVGRPFRLEIFRVGGPTVARASVQLHLGGWASVTAIGVVAGPQSLGRYQLRVTDDADGGGTPLGLLMLANHAGGEPTVNVFGALTL